MWEPVKYLKIKEWTANMWCEQTNEQDGLDLLRNEWISLFTHGTFQRYVFMLSARFFRTSGNGSSCLAKHEATFSSLNISRRTYCSGKDEHACDTIIFFLMLETEESIFYECVSGIRKMDAAALFKRHSESAGFCHQTQRNAETCF